MDLSTAHLEGALVHERVRNLRVEACRDAVARRAVQLLACCAPLWQRTLTGGRSAAAGTVAWLRHGQLGPVAGPCGC